MGVSPHWVEMLVASVVAAPVNPATVVMLFHSIRHAYLLQEIALRHIPIGSPIGMNPKNENQPPRRVAVSFRKVDWIEQT